MSSQEMLDIKTGLAQKDIERLENDAREAKKACDQLQDLYQQRDTILSKCTSVHLTYFSNVVHIHRPTV